MKHLWQLQKMYGNRRLQVVVMVIALVYYTTISINRPVIYHSLNPVSIISFVLSFCLLGRAWQVMIVYFCVSVSDRLLLNSLSNPQNYEIMSSQGTIETILVASLILCAAVAGRNVLLSLLSDAIVPPTSM